MKRMFLILFLLMMACCGNAAVVHVTQQTVAGGVTNVLSATTAETAASYTTRAAPAKSGYVFTHWSIEPASTNVFANRDGLGRALDAAKYLLYEDVTLTANYLPASTDSDADGLADGCELYWYGSLDVVSAETDTDGDGMPLAQELELGTNPFFADSFAPGGVEVLSGGDTLQYNPKNLQHYVIRSEPVGKLFATVSNLVLAGTSVTTPSYDSASSSFAYWTKDGIRQSDALGRALDRVTFTMPTNAIELVAVCETDATKRRSMYWYGTDEVSADSDTDGDGATFAQEMELGTNPLFADTFVSGGIEVLPGTGVLQYNPKNLQYYIIRSDPEKKLFATISNLVAAGTVVTTPSCSPASSTFAYWLHDGKRQTDALGRALNQVRFIVPTNTTELVAVTVEDEATRLSEYWYGRGDIAQNDDTDGDGLSFAEELELGTSPHFADTFAPGGVENFPGVTLEVNLQPYEQAEGVVVDGSFVQMFTSLFAGNAADSMTFGTYAAPAVVDWNADGLNDLLILSRGAAALYLNVGSKDNPEFKTGTLPDAFMAAVVQMERPIPEGDGTNGVYVCDNGGNVMYYAMVSGTWTATDRSGAPGVLGGILATLGEDGRLLTNDVNALTLDLPVEEGISISFGDTDGDGDFDLLASDTAGRIWNYRNEGDCFVLQDKVWGGSSRGFAEGLVIATLDWEDDGDLDCLCGTADGKLMLLKNPEIGRPTNLAALSGADNVLLEWSANAQSRVRGYRVYRSTAGEEEYTSLVSPYASLPTYRDKPDSLEPYDYKVSAVSRFYTAGNSVPTEKESIATDPVRVNFGRVVFAWHDAIGFAGDELEVTLSVDNSMGLSAAGGEAVVVFDADVLIPVEVRLSGLTERAEFSAVVGDGGVWRVTFTDGEIAAGRGSFITFVFRAAKVCETEVALSSASFKAASGASLNVIVPSRTASVKICAKEPDTPSDVVPPWSLGDMNGDGRLSKEDLQILSRLKQSNKPKWTEQELRAGDFNKNRLLDNYDHARLRELLREIGVMGGGK